MWMKHCGDYFTEQTNLLQFIKKTETVAIIMLIIYFYLSKINFNYLLHNKKDTNEYLYNSEYISVSNSIYLTPWRAVSLFGESPVTDKRFL